MSRRRVDPGRFASDRPGRLLPIAKVCAGILLGAAAVFVAAVVLVAALTGSGVAAGFSTMRSNLGTSGPQLSTTAWGGCAAIVAFAVGGWVAARVAGARGAGRGALIGLVAGVVAAAAVVVVVSATLRPAMDFRSAVIELGAVAVAETDPAAGDDPGAPTIDYNHRFIEATIQAVTYLAVVLLLVLGAAAFGGIAGAAPRGR